MVYNSQPPIVGTNTFASPLNKFIEIIVDDSIKSELNHSIIKMYYTDAEVAAANIQEATMRLSKWNGSEWIVFNPPRGGVDTINKFVWANTSSFSTWNFWLFSSCPFPLWRQFRWWWKFWRRRRWWRRGIRICLQQGMEM